MSFNINDYVQEANGTWTRIKVKPKATAKVKPRPKSELGSEPIASKNRNTLGENEERYATFEVPGRFPTLNDILSAKNNPHVYNKMKKDIEEVARTYYKLQKPLDVQLPFKRKIRFQFVWYVNGKNKDADNIDAARKFFIDAMVDEQIILKDNLTIFTEYEALFVIDKVNPRVVINLVRPKFNFI